MKNKGLFITVFSILAVFILLLAMFTIRYVDKIYDADKAPHTQEGSTTNAPDSSSPQDSQDSDSTVTPEDESADTNEPQVEPEPEPITYYSYTGEIPHIFTHCLIAYPELKGSDGNMIYDSDCINVTEFKNLLQELYDNGYSLVDIYDTFSVDENGEYRWAESIEVPEGRKPIVVSIDDVVYDERKRGNGMVDLLALDENNNIVAGTYNDDSTITYSDDNEFVPILEAFIKEHPDFSSHGSRVTLCMTGFTGVFGYRTDSDYTGDRQAEIQKATAVANRLKELGYSFACHGFGHYDATKLSVEKMKWDIQKFHEEVVPIIGEVSVYIYPYGKNLSPSDAKYQALIDSGYALFCSVSHFFYSRDYEDGRSLYMTRMAIDGYSLRHYKEALSLVIDVEDVIDSTNRLPE